MRDLEKALIEDPEGKYCAKCKKENLFADDCGFFYNVLEDNSYKAVCIDCNTMPPGDR